MRVRFKAGDTEWNLGQAQCDGGRAPGSKDCSSGSRPTWSLNYSGRNTQNVVAPSQQGRQCNAPQGRRTCIVRPCTAIQEASGIEHGAQQMQTDVQLFLFLKPDEGWTCTVLGRRPWTGGLACCPFPSPSLHVEQNCPHPSNPARLVFTRRWFLWSCRPQHIGVQRTP